MTDPRDRLPSLDGLRAVSIGLVVLNHVCRTPGFPVPTEFTEGWSEALGGLGVRVFFVISGFLITTLLLNEMSRSGSLNLPRFYFRRSLRIFVPYYAFLAVMFLLSTHGVVSLTSGDLAHGVTYTVNYFPARSWDLGHAWSLAVEEQFYLLWPAVLLLAGPRRGLLLAAALVLLAPIIRIAYFYFSPGLVPYEVGYRFETVGDALASGCLLAGLLQWLGGQSLYRRAMGSKLVALVPVIVIGAAMIPPTSRIYLMLGITVQNFGIAVCIAWCLSHSAGRVAALLNSRPLVALGLMSYSVYLWQQPFMNPAVDAPLSRFPLNLLALGAAALASYCLVERPALSWRRQLEERLFGGRSRVLLVDHG